MQLPLEFVSGVLASPAQPFQSSALITGWSVDSRTVNPGDLFVAVRGERHDGHDHVGAAFEKGAIAAIVERPVEGSGPVITVSDSVAALQQVAGAARERWGGEVIGVTGSAGKTTTKDAIAHLLATTFTVGKTTGNFNNHIGVPLSLLRIPGDATHAVIEIGMNHAGEIRSLAAIARPNSAAVTNVGHAHVENFPDGIDGIAAAKAELVEGLPSTGTAILNADDSRVAAMAPKHSGKVVRFGVSEAADVRATGVEYLESGVRFRVEGTLFESSVQGRHGLMNLLCGIAVAGVYGISTERLCDAVRSFVPGKMRGSRINRSGILIYDDSYNANPDAVRAMIDVLRDTPARRRIAVLGEMLELGRWAEPLHRDVGKYVAVSGISVLVGIRGVARHMVDAAIQGGLAVNAAFFFEDPESAGDFLKTFAREGDAILFKGSRGTQVERALRRFSPAPEDQR